MRGESLSLRVGNAEFFGNKSSGVAIVMRTDGVVLSTFQGKLGSENERIIVKLKNMFKKRRI